MSCDLYKMRRMKLCIEFETIKNYKIARRKNYQRKRNKGYHFGTGW